MDAVRLHLLHTVLFFLFPGRHCEVTLNMTISGNLILGGEAYIRCSYNGTPDLYQVRFTGRENKIYYVVEFDRTRSESKVTPHSLTTGRHSLDSHLVTTVTMHIKNLQCDDSHFYICLLQYQTPKGTDAGKVVKDSIFFAKAPEFKVTLTTFPSQLIAGQKGRLECEWEHETFQTVVLVRMVIDNHFLIGYVVMQEWILKVNQTNVVDSNSKDTLRSRKLSVEIKYIDVGWSGKSLRCLVSSLGEPFNGQGCRAAERNLAPSVRSCTLSKERAQARSASFGETGYLYCSWFSDCPDQKMYFRFSAPHRQPVVITEMGKGKTSGDQVDYLYHLGEGHKSWIEMRIKNLSCHDEGIFTCQAKILASRQVAESILKEQLKLKGEERPTVTIIQPVNTLEIDDTQNVIRIRCSLYAQHDQGSSLEWRIYGNLRNISVDPHWTSLDYESHDPRRDCLQPINVNIQVSRFDLQDNTVVHFLCFVTLKTGSISPTDKNSARTPKLKIKPCAIDLSLQSGSEISADKLTLTCKWVNNCPNCSWSWKINTTIGWFITPSENPRNVLVKADYLRRSTGSIIVTVDKDPVWYYTIATCSAAYTKSATPAFMVQTKQKIILRDCYNYLQCTGSAVTLGKRALVMCLWHTHCPRRAWTWKVGLDYQIILSSDTINVTGDGKVKVTVTINSEGQSYKPVMVLVNDMTCEPLRVTVICGYVDGNETDEHPIQETIQLETAEALAVGDQYLSIVRSTPPLHQLKKGVKEDSLIFMTCEVTTPDPTAYLEWLIFSETDQELLKMKNLTVSENLPDKACARRLESTVSLKMTRDWHRTAVQCIRVDKFTDRRKISCAHNFEKYCISTGPIDVHFPISETTTFLVADSNLIQSGGNATLTCCADGYPRPKFTWSTSSSNRTFHFPEAYTFHNCSILALTRLLSRDSGTYSCLVAYTSFDGGLNIHKETFLKVLAEEGTQVSSGITLESIQKNATESTAETGAIRAQDEGRYRFLLALAVLITIMLLILCRNVSTHRRDGLYEDHSLRGESQLSTSHSVNESPAT